MVDYIEIIKHDSVPYRDNIRKIYPRMTLQEYEDMGEGISGELINGRFYAMSGVSPIHQRIVVYLLMTIGSYIKSKKDSCEVFTAPLDVKLFENEDTILQPDVLVVCDPKKITDKRVEGAPDLAIEVVSSSNPGHDYIRKLDLYMKAGVREYWIVDPTEKRIVVYIPGTADDKEITVQFFGFSDEVPVYIYDNELRISLAEFD